MATNQLWTSAQGALSFSAREWSPSKAVVAVIVVSCRWKQLQLVDSVTLFHFHLVQLQTLRFHQFEVNGLKQRENSVHGERGVSKPLLGPEHSLAPTSVHGYFSWKCDCRKRGTTSGFSGNNYGSVVLCLCLNTEGFCEDFIGLLNCQVFI